jgi:hypothetical protein
MLRITRHDSDDSAVLSLEGKLLEAWFDELKSAVDAADDRRSVILDLTQLSFADGGGALLLATLRRRGVRLRSPSPLLSALIEAAMP